MRKTIGICSWALLAAAAVALPQESPGAKPPEEEKAPGKRLRVEFRETRQRGEATTAVRPCVVTLHADAQAASVFVGAQVTMTTSDQGTIAMVFKNAGIEAQASAKTLPDGRYRLDAKFEDSSALGAGGGAAASTAVSNPIFRIVRGESRLTLREGETVPLASVVDPVTGEVVRVDVTVTAAPVSKPATSSGGEARLRARLVLVRRQGETTVARRPYSLVVDAGGASADVFGGSMLPVQVRHEGQPTIMLKDVGAGLRLTAHRIPDGRLRLDLGFSDGVLSPAEGSPRLREFHSESQLFAREGETITVASAVDPQSGEVVEAELTLEGVR
jgi:Flp pilus assembly secretin CpaC